MADYQEVADALAAEITSGRLKPGARLQPQRTFAYARGIAVSTASRVYAELIRRGLVIGEVGRGTFVRAPGALRAAFAAESIDAPIDLQFATAMTLEQAALLAPALEAIGTPAALYGTMEVRGPFGPRGAGAIGAKLLERRGWRVESDCVLFSGGGRQSIATAIATLCKPGDRLGVEPLTYPSVIGTAQLLGVTLVPIEMDGEGIKLSALLRAHRSRPLTALYIQPTIHNPLGVSMSEARRHALARALEELDLPCIEDAAFSFLSDAVPLAAFAPKRVIYIDTASKRIGLGSGLGFVVTPTHLRERAASAMRTGSWTASSLVLRLILSVIADGTAARLAALKRKDARQRQALAARVLGPARISAHPLAFFVWLEIPEPWRADMFVSAAALRGVAITPGNAFAVQPGHAPNSVRIAISGPAIEDLERGLNVIQALITSAPYETAIE